MTSIDNKLVICGVYDMPLYIERKKIGAVITASTAHIKREMGDRLIADEALRAIRDRSLPHFYSRLFHLRRGDMDFSRFAKPEEVRAAFVETCAAFDAQIKGMAPDRRAMIHCIGGKDRSAAIALLLLYRENKNLTEALSAVYRLRREATLQIMPGFLAPCFEEMGSPDPKAAEKEVARYARVVTSLEEEKDRASQGGFGSIRDMFAAEAKKAAGSAAAEALKERQNMAENWERYGMDLAVPKL